MRARALTVVAVIGVTFLLSPTPATRSRPRAAAASYVTSTRCAGCHPVEYALWRGSHHAVAMQPATDDSVLGNFDNAVVEQRGRAWRFFRKEGAHTVAAEGPDGALHEYAVAYTFGVDPLQQYLVELPGGRLQALSMAWDTRARRWFSLDAERTVAPGDWLHWTGQAHNWNSMCADCHSTAVEKHYDSATDHYATTYQEVSVGCEACHGPGSQHADEPAVALAVARPRGPELVDACAACHARRSPLTDPGSPGQPLLDRYLPSLLSAGAYFADGQILDEVFEVQSFWQSKMYARGVACTDCHDVHSGRLRATGNALCTRCHSAERFDSPAHHGHAERSPAAQCVSCHMPARGYMVVHLRRDHSLRVPRPDLTDSSAAPSACAASGCHDSRPAGWIVDSFARLYGARPRREHWGPVLAAGRAGAAEAEPALARLALDVARPAIVRASALELLGGYAGEPSRTALERALDDPDGLVRSTAASHLPLYDPADAARRLAALCSDPLRSVRVAAAARLTDVPQPALAAEQARACSRSLDEYVASQTFVADMPSGPFNLGNLYTNLGRTADAEQAYRRALAIDAQFVPAEIDLALLLAGQQRLDEAEALLRAVTHAQPQLATAALDLGLLLAERGKPAEAETMLRSALETDPTLAVAAYNLGVLVQDRRPAEALALFRQAARLRPDDSRYARAAESVFAKSEGRR